MAGRRVQGRGRHGRDCGHCETLRQQSMLEGRGVTVFMLAERGSDTYIFLGGYGRTNGPGPSGEIESALLACFCFRNLSRSADGGTPGVCYDGTATTADLRANAQYAALQT